MLKLSDILSIFRKRSPPSNKVVNNISNWILTAERKGVEASGLIAKLHSEKLGDYERLRNSRFPRFDDLEIPYSQFDWETPSVEEFFTKYQDVVIRLIPKTKDLARNHKIGLTSYYQCLQWVDENAAPGRENDYTILMTEHEPTNWSGIIISKGDEAFIDVSDSPLDDLEHGTEQRRVNGCYGDPGTANSRRFVYRSFDSSLAKPAKTHGFIAKAMQFSRRFVYRTFNSSLAIPEDPNVHGKYLSDPLAAETHDFTTKATQLIWRSAQYIRTDDIFEIQRLPAMTFKKGYFEFVVTEKDSKIVFVDYKTNPGYIEYGNKQQDPRAKVRMSD